MIYLFEIVQNPLRTKNIWLLFTKFLAFAGHQEREVSSTYSLVGNLYSPIDDVSQDSNMKQN